jgi:hypothetical protein
MFEYIRTLGMVLMYSYDPPNMHARELPNDHYSETRLCRW